MFRKFDCIGIGDPAFDVILDIPDAELYDVPTTEGIDLCLPFGKKILITSRTFSPGGNANNTIVGLARLGLKTGYYGVVGGDEYGSFLIQNLEQEKVKIKWIKKEKNGATNYSTILNYKGERTILVQHMRHTHSLPSFPRTRWVYASTVSDDSTRIWTQLATGSRKGKYFFALTPDVQHLTHDSAKAHKILQSVSLLFVNKEEADEIIRESFRTMKRRLRALAELGVKMMCVTDGVNGAFAFDGTRYWRIDIAEVNVKERTGAGDAFAAGVLAGMIQGKSLSRSLIWGMLNSASVVTHVGSQAGLLSRKDIKRWEARYPKLKARQLR